MNNEDVKKYDGNEKVLIAFDLAREVADKDKVDPVNSQGDMITLFPEELMRLIDRVQMQEREACAKLCDEEYKKYDYFDLERVVAKLCADAIRARGEVK